MVSPAFAPAPDTTEQQSVFGDGLSTADTLATGAPSGLDGDSHAGDGITDDTAAVQAAMVVPKPAIDPERVRAMEEELTAQRKFREDTERERAAAQQQQVQQQFVQSQQAVMQKLQEYGLPTTEAETLAADIATVQFIQTPAGRQQLVEQVVQSEAFKQHPIYQQANRAAATATAWQLIADNFGPQTTIAAALDVHKDLMQYTDPQLMKQRAQMLAENRRSTNARQRAASGAETVESGNGSALGGMTHAQTWAAYGRGEIEWSPRVAAAGRAMEGL